MNKLSNYLKESVLEMKKVTWPSKKETRSYTFLVITISLATMIFLGLWDFVFMSAFQYLVVR
ncbi:MAG: preprotein translocase subunit SecE [Patescibacteria group bacterium]